jgi:hypothetical protein
LIFIEEVLRAQIEAYRNVFVDAATNVEKLDQGIAKYHGVRPVEVIQEEIKFIFK